MTVPNEPTIDQTAATTGYATPVVPPAGLPTIPGYEVESVLGRGGMGIVYRARHVALNRLVALKMILARGQASEAELARFRGEVQAIARLQHPNIVQIYEVGEYAGMPYCALEFVAGGALSDKLQGKPLAPNEAAHTVEVLARAMQVAHAHNIVHRDLKPANVLLGTDGVPRIADFGLARDLTAASHETQAGAVLGTPSYMAPEQAEGRTHEAGPAADVWALGAILYECLTGRPPFRGTTLLETLRLVASTEVVPPSRLNPQIPRDLEVICLACLRKEPEQRYASAEALAEDLRRWRAGEPIQARPVGTAERIVKWVRRRPALAGVLALALLGLGLTVWFALDAQAARLRQAQSEAAAADSALAQVLARPLGYQAGPLGAHELDALWDLATLDRDRVRLEFFAQALNQPSTATRLARRAELAVQAAIGLDPTRSQAVRALLLARLTDDQQPAATREASALLAVAVGDLEPPLAQASAQALLASIPNAPSERLPRVVRALHQLAPALPPEEAAAFPVQTADALLASLLATTDPPALMQRADLLALLADRLAPAAASTVGTRALRHLVDIAARDGDLGGELVEALRFIAKLVGPDAAARLFHETLDRLAGISETTNRGVAAQAVELLAAHLSEADAATAAQRLLDLLPAADPRVQVPLARASTATAERLAAAEAIKLFLPVQALMVRQPPIAPLLPALSTTLTALAGRLSPADAALIFPPLLPNNFPLLARHLAPARRVLADRLPTADCGAAATKVLDRLKLVLGRLPVPREEAHALGELLVTLAGRMARAEAAPLCGPAARLYADYAARPSEPHEHGRRAALAGTLAGWLPADEAAALRAGLARPLRDLVTDKADLGNLVTALPTLMALGEGLPPREVEAQHAAITRTLRDRLAARTSTTDLTYLGPATAAVAAKLPPEAAARVAADIYRPVLEIVLQQPRWELPRLAPVLVPLGAHLAPEEAAGIVPKLLARLDLPGVPTVPLYQILLPLADRLPADAIVAPTRRILAEVDATSDPAAALALADLLARLVARLPADDAGDLRFAAAQRLLDLSGRTSAPAVLPPALTRLTAGSPEADFVELLKHPCAVGPIREVLQTALRHRLGILTATRSELLTHLRDNGADLHSPPRRLAP